MTEKNTNAASQPTTRGSKSSERRSCYHAFYAGLIIAFYGLYKGIDDLSGLGVLIGAVCAPLMFYAGARTAYKRVKGEKNVEVNPPAL